MAKPAKNEPIIQRPTKRQLMEMQLDALETIRDLAAAILKEPDGPLDKILREIKALDMEMRHPPRTFDLGPALAPLDHLKPHSEELRNDLLTDLEKQMAYQSTPLSIPREAYFMVKEALLLFQGEKP